MGGWNSTGLWFNPVSLINVVIKTGFAYYEAGFLVRGFYLSCVDGLYLHERKSVYLFLNVTSSAANRCNYLKAEDD